MVTVVVAVCFFAAAFIATVAAMALSFLSRVEWSIACGAIAVIAALAGLFFIWIDWKRNPREKE